MESNPFESRIQVLEKILAGWLFSPPHAYNHFVALHNEWCDLKGRPWEKKSFVENRYLVYCVDRNDIPEYGPYPPNVFSVIGYMDPLTYVRMREIYGCGCRLMEGEHVRLPDENGGRIDQWLLDKNPV